MLLDLTVQEVAVIVQALAFVVAARHGLDLASFGDIVSSAAVQADLSDRLYSPSHRDLDAGDVRVLGDPRTVLETDLLAVDCVLFAATAELSIHSAGHLNGALLYFELELDDETTISTSLGASRTLASD